MMRSQTIRGALVVLALASAAAFAGCGDDRISERRAKSYVETWSEKTTKSLDEAVDVDAAGDRFASRVKKLADEQEQDVGRSRPPYDLFVREAYRELDWEFRLTDEDGWTKRGETVWQIVSSAEDHAIDTEPFEFETIESELDKLETARERIDELRDFTLTDEQRSAGIKWLTSQYAADLDFDSGALGQLARGVAEKRKNGELAQRLQDLTEARRRASGARARLEHLLARDTVRYSRKMKHFRVRHLFIHDREDDYWNNPVVQRENDHLDRPDKAEASRAAGQVWRQAANVADEKKNEVEILHRRMKRTLRRVLEEEKPGEVLRGLEPDHPQYAKLLEAFERYHSIVADGGWPEVPVDHGLRPGVENENVETLKRRLQVEGYFPDDAEIDAKYDDKLADAIRSYQETHQMRVTGEPHDMFWSSVNQSAEQRMNQIALNLARWRESNVRHDDGTYVFVNIPGFTVEFWKDRNRKMQFPIVVGKNDQKKDDQSEGPAGMAIEPDQVLRRDRRRAERRREEEKEKEKKEDEKEDEFLYDTPELSAYIDRVIYNPYWNITDSIRRTEILPKVRRFIENKYIDQLRDLRHEKQTLERELAKSDSQPEEDRTLVATRSSSSDPSTGTDPSADDETSDEEGRAPAEADQSGESESPEEGAADTPADSPEAEAGDDETSGAEAKADDKEEEPERPKVDDLYETDEIENTEKLVKKYRMFDVPKIRKLVESVRRLEQKKEKRETEESGFAAAIQPTDASGESDGSATDGEEDSSSEDDKSPLERRFRYLDLETGLVDVSSTDPDNVPDWYEENDYQVMFPGKDWEYVRQMQGDENALGRVKVIFPNNHGVYLHDTPKKELFNRDIRAFSHGCMRMEKPLEFAEEVLRTDGRFGEVNVRQLLEGEEVEVEREDGEGTKKETEYTYKPVFLDSPIPVHVDYFTVHVDDQGRPHFYADIYDKDEERLEGDESSNEEGAEQEQPSQ